MRLGLQNLQNGMVEAILFYSVSILTDAETFTSFVILYILEALSNKDTAHVVENVYLLKSSQSKYTILLLTNDVYTVISNSLSLPICFVMLFSFMA